MAFETHGESNRFRPTYDPVEDAADLAELTTERYAERVNAELARLMMNSELSDSVSPATPYILSVALWKESSAQWDAVPTQIVRDSNGNPITESDGSYLYSRASSAFGGFQILPTNWSTLVERHPKLFPSLPDGATPDTHNFRADERFWSPEVQARGAFILSADDQRMYRNGFANRDFTTTPLTGGEVYGLHFHGAPVMRSLIGVSDDTVLSEVLSSAVLRANGTTRLPERIDPDRPAFASWTVGQLTQWRQDSLATYLPYAIEVASLTSLQPEYTASYYQQAILTGTIDDSIARQSAGLSNTPLVITVANTAADYEPVQAVATAAPPERSGWDAFWSDVSTGFGLWGDPNPPPPASEPVLIAQAEPQSAIDGIAELIGEHTPPAADPNAALAYAPLQITVSGGASAVAPETVLDITVTGNGITEQGEQVMYVTINNTEAPVPVAREVIDRLRANSIEELIHAAEAENPSDTPTNSQGAVMRL